MVIVNNIKPPEAVKPINSGTPLVTKSQPQGASFAQVLGGEISRLPVSFSKHATARLQSRDINLSSDQLERIERGVSTASAKGIRDSLVLVDNMALVVNVPKKLVVTAMLSEQAPEGVFTNIDGAVIV